jgi:tRNA pseudouridine synthase
VPRYKLTIEYDGAPFVGWQRQDNGPSIQGALEDAVFAFCGERVAVHGAGRTDTGVHALGQVAHLDLVDEKPADTVRAAVNFHLKPNPIVITEAEIVPGDFQALAALPPSIWLNCASLTFSSSACVFSSSASFWPRLASERPARLVLPDDLRLPIIWTISKAGHLPGEARPLGGEVLGFSLSSAQRPNDS